MNAKSIITIIAIIFISFAVGKYCSTDLRGVKRETTQFARETRDYQRETTTVGEEITRIDDELWQIGEYLNSIETGQVDIRSSGDSDWDSNWGSNYLSNYDEIKGTPEKCSDVELFGKTEQVKGVIMRKGIAVVLIDLFKNTPALIEQMIIAFIIYLVVFLLKKSYQPFFDRELAYGVKAKHLIPVVILIIGTIYYLLICKETFLISLIDGGILSLFCIIFDNSWNAIKNAFKSLAGWVGVGFKK